MGFIDQSSTEICRLCLAQSKIYFSILENATISETLESLTSMKIIPTDEISTKICLKCRLNLNLAYTIQQNMLKAEQRFRDRGEAECNNIKEEIFIIQESENEIEDQNLNIDEPSLSSIEIQTKKDVKTNKEHSCDICERIYSTRLKLSRHKYNMHTKRKCPICGKELTGSNLSHHITIHSNNILICELCGSTFKTKNTLRSHIYYKHRAAKHKCQFCERIFKQRREKDAHEKKQHGGEANFVCDTCGKKFYANKRLLVHVRMTHLKLRPYECEFCGSRFSSSHALKIHRRQHTNETPYRCEVCDDGFRQKVSLKSHLKSKHGILEEETCRCDVCGKGFASQEAIDSHQRIHR